MKPLELRQLNNLILIKNSRGNTVGFHTENLQIAELSFEAWDSINNQGFNIEAHRELLEWNAELDPEASNEASAKGIKSLTINVTQICNLHCTYCAAGGDGTYGDPFKKISIEKTIPQLKYFFDKSEDGQTFSINFLGGEPLLYADSLLMLGEYAKQRSLEKNIHLTLWVTTNGTLFNDKNIEILSQLRANITISIDGPKEITDKVRPSNNGQSTTAQFEAGMKLLSAHKRFGKIRLHAVFGAHNLEVERVYDYFSQFDVDHLTFGYDVNETNPQIAMEYASKLAEVGHQALTTGGEKALRKIDFFDNLFYRLDNQKRLQNYCGAGKSFLMVDAKNNLFTCPWDVNEKEEMVGSGTLLFDKKLDFYKDPLTENTNCQSCWAKNLCGGGCLRAHKMASGDKKTLNQSFCLKMKYLISQGILLYELTRASQGSKDQEIL